jgi:unsaturated chondroitin disaccharide hydrolase
LRKFCQIGTDVQTLSDPYFAHAAEPKTSAQHKAALERCVTRLREQMPVNGLRNPKIGDANNQWIYCDGPDWVVGFYSGILWLTFQLCGDVALLNAVRARRPVFRHILEHRRGRTHDVGFQFSLHAVADWLLTGDTTARDMALAAANTLIGRFRPEGGYIQAWSPLGPTDRRQAAFVNGRMIADTMQNLALLHWAYRETGITDYQEVAEIHAETAANYLVRSDATSFHTFVFDPATGEPRLGETHQGYADDSCWARGQAWLIHGFARCHAATGNPAHLTTACRLAGKAKELIGERPVPLWDYALPANEPQYVDSSAAAITAAGVYLLADQVPAEEAAGWRSFGDRLIDGLLNTCDLTQTPNVQGFLGHGAAHVPAGRCDTMLPYGDYYFMEALMRSLGHRSFFW